jgi:hypothetical protein
MKDGIQDPKTNCPYQVGTGGFVLARFFVNAGDSFRITVF